MNAATDDNAARSTPVPLRTKVIRNRWTWGSLALLVLASIPIYHAVHAAANSDPVNTNATAVAVAVAKVTREDMAQELILDAELRPYQEVDLHAKIAGFLEKITVDIGDRVEAGQLLATLEVPELTDDITRSQAMQRRSEQEVLRAEAAYEEAHLGHTRLLAVEKGLPNLIAQQDLDAARSKDRVAESTLAAAKAQVEVACAEVSKLRTMLKFSRITAPFPGVVTKRYADPGALIQAGTSSSTQTLPLMRLSENDKLRLVFPVSVTYVTRIKVGDPVEVRVEGRTKPLFGTIARSTRKVESTTRKMEVEVDIPNSDLTLIPGVYASVVLNVDRREKTLVVPVEALSRSKTTTAYVVNKAHCIEERTLVLGLESAHKIEVLRGLEEDDLVMIGNRTQIKPGQLVDPRLIASASLP